MKLKLLLLAICPPLGLLAQSSNTNESDEKVLKDIQQPYHKIADSLMAIYNSWTP